MIGWKKRAREDCSLVVYRLTEGEVIGEVEIEMERRTGLTRVVWVWIGRMSRKPPGEGETKLVGHESGKNGCNRSAGHTLLVVME